MAATRTPPAMLVQNVLDGRAYPNHPAIQMADASMQALEHDYLLELNGLRVPAEFDCDMFNSWQHWGNHYYFFEVPSRWYACWQHHAAVQSGLLSESPASLLVDEEYSETVAVYQAVLRANASRPWVMAELGARWGTWASRSVAFLRALRGNAAPYDVYVVESSAATNCPGIERVMGKNEIRYKLDCTKATSALFGRWAATVEHIDVVDFDVQNAERLLVPELHEILRAKAYRLIIGTHSADTHAKLRAYLTTAGWLREPRQKRCFTRCPFPRRDHTIEHTPSPHRYAPSPHRYAPLHTP